MGRSLYKRRYDVKDESGQIIFTGRIEEIANEFKVSVKTIQGVLCSGRRLMRKYHLREALPQHMLYKVTNLETEATVIGSWEELLEKLGYSEHVTLMIKNNKYAYGKWKTDELGYYIKNKGEWQKV